MQQYELKLYEELRENLERLKNAIKNGDHVVIEKTSKSIVKLADTIYEHTPAGITTKHATKSKLARRLLQHAIKMKKTKNTDKFEETLKEFGKL